jgi:hypothetical protein
LLATAHQDRELAARGLLGWRLLLFFVLLLMGVSALAGVLSSLMAKGGLALRLVGLAVVGPDGHEVSRGRGSVRALIGWSPAIAACVAILWIALRGPLEERSLAELAPALVPLSVFLGGALLGLRDPRRGPHDRLTGTMLVAR